MTFKKIVMPLMLASVLCIPLVGCSSGPVKPGNYNAADVGKINKVAPGTIVSMRPVNIRNKADANGIDTPDINNTIARSHGFEYVIKLNNGAIVSLVQTEESELKVKQHVLVIYGDNTRVVADNGSEDY
jgi:outer membrane lipoprotein SlyB